MHSYAQQALLYYENCVQYKRYSTVHLKYSHTFKRIQIYLLPQYGKAVIWIKNTVIMHLPIWANGHFKGEILMIFEPVSPDYKITTDSRHHSFPVAIAMDYSVHMALWLSHLAFWIEKHLSDNKNIHDGLCWNYTTVEALGDLLPYMTINQRRTVIDSSIKEGLVIKGNYNKNQYDRTVWYALTPKGLLYFAYILSEKNLKALWLSICEKTQMDLGEFTNGFGKNHEPIPNTLPDTKPDNKKEKNITKKEKDFSSDNEDTNYTQGEDIELEEQPNQKSGYYNNHGASQNISSNPHESKIDSSKSDYFDNQSKKETKSKSKNPSELKYILENNIFNIPEQMIRDFITFRNKKTKPVTKTVWNSVNKNLAQCEKDGNDPSKCFEETIAKGWLVPDPTYFHKKNTQLKPTYDDTDTSWINQKLFEDMY